MTEVIIKPRWPTIQGKPLDANDLERPIDYQPYPNAPFERGYLSSFRETGSIYVRFRGPQGERCPPSTLTWGDIHDQ